MNNQELDQLINESVRRHDSLQKIEREVMHEIRHTRRLALLGQVGRWVAFAAAMSITLWGCITIAKEYVFTGEGLTSMNILFGIGIGLVLWITERLISYFSIDKM